MNDMEKLRRRAFAKQGRFLTPGTVGGLAGALCVMLTALVAHDRWQAGWLLWLAGISSLVAMLIFAAALGRFLVGESGYEPNLLRPSRNDDYIAGPPVAVAKSPVPSVAAAAYGAWALVAGEAWVLWVDLPFILWWEGLECRLYGTGLACSGMAAIVRNHTRWRRAHLGFGILAAAALAAFIAALVVWERG